MGFRGNDRKGTGFTNINRVLKANTGNRLGSTVASNVQNTAQNVKDQAQKSQQKFQEEAQKNRLDTEEAKGKRDEIIGRFTGPVSTAQQTSAAPQQNAAVSGTNQVANQVAQSNQPRQTSGIELMDSNMSRNSDGTLSNKDGSPVTFDKANQAPIVSEDEIKDFTRFRTGTYAGPTGLEDYQTLAGQASEAQALGDLTRSTGGRQELLRRTVGGDNYNQGQQRLDTLLLGQSGTQGLNQARKATRGLESDVQAANQQAGNLAQEYANRAKIFGQETVGQLQGARDPISKQIDDRLAQLQKEEEDRIGFKNEISNTLLGQGEQFKGLDRVARLGLGLQSAMDAGFITQDQANQLLGDNGLISRAEQLGLDTNALLNERIKDIAAQNLNRGGAADAAMEARISGLDRLLGKQGTDVEFGQAGADYVKGGLGFNLDSLGEYIGKTEREKAQKDAKYAEELAAREARYLNQAQAGLQNSLGGTMQVGGALLNQTLNPESYYNPSEAIGNVADLAGGVAQTGLGQAQAFTQGQNALLEGLTKLNIGGQSLANTEGGRQLLKAIELKSKLENEAGKQAGQLANAGVNAINATANGSLLEQLTGLGAARSLASDLSKQVSGQISNAGRTVGNALKSISNPKIKIKKPKIKISDENLKKDIKPAENKLYELLDRLNAHDYEYVDKVGEPGRHISVMAQELEKSDLGKEAVEESEMGKMVDYEKLEPVQLAAISSLHKRLKKLEGKE